jgi:hypothetical protein
LVMWKNIFPRVMDEWYYGWKWGLKMTMDEIFHEHAQQVLFCKNLNKKTRYKKFMLVYCEQSITWNVQFILEQIFHIAAL